MKPAGLANAPKRRTRARIGYLFLLPSLIIFLIFRQGPAIVSLFMGFFEWSVVDRPHFIGLANYQALFNDPVFWRSLTNTVAFVFMTVPADLVLAMLLALLLNQPIRGLTIFRLAYFLPVVTATAIVSIVWRWIYQPKGMANALLDIFSLGPLSWLSDPAWALPALAVMAVWKHVGFNMLILLAGLQAIPLDYEEAARMDGAGPVSIFFGITLPLLKPTIVLIAILTTISSFQVFDSAYVMTNGGPFYATTTLVFSIYQNAFDRYQMGYAAAIAFVLFVIILLVSMIQRRLLQGSNDVQ